MKIPSLTALLCFALALSVPAQSTIAYYNGPAFQIPSYYENSDTDNPGIGFSANGSAEFSFFGGVALTAGLSTGFTEPYYVAALNTNAVLCHGDNLAVVPAGTLIGGPPSPNAGWSNNVDGATLTVFGYSPGSAAGGLISFGGATNAGGASWGGPLGLGQDGYLGVRFYLGDGLHYGWIHASLAGDDAYGAVPTITDWAYETSVNTPIIEGTLPTAVLNAPLIVRTGNLRLVWPTLIGEAYQVQYKNQLDAPAWSNLDVTIIATATNTAVDAPMSASAAFYRIVQVQ